MNNSTSLVQIDAHLVGPKVVECFVCDAAIPIDYIHWYSELSNHGRLLALLPYCETCLDERELKYAEQAMGVEMEQKEAAVARRHHRPRRPFFGVPAVASSSSR
jgi:hypothetical protein